MKIRSAVSPSVWEWYHFPMIIVDVSNFTIIHGFRAESDHSLSVLGRCGGARYPDPALGTVWGFRLQLAKCLMLMSVCSTIGLVSEWRNPVWKATNWFSWYSNSVFTRKTIFSVGLLTFRDPQCVAHDNFESFARLTSSEIFPFAVDSPPVDRVAPSHKSPEVQGVAAILESMAANKFRTIVTGDESWFTLEYQHSAK
jgi:hypothetical protein